MERGGKNAQPALHFRRLLTDPLVMSTVRALRTGAHRWPSWINSPKIVQVKPEFCPVLSADFDYPN
jgi:hypothetical protein